MLADPEAIVVSRESMQEGGHAIVLSNVSFVNALLEQLLRIDELARDAVRSYYVDYLYAQVMNGGFSQFVYNSRWNSTITTTIREGLDAMGATRQRAAFERGARTVNQIGAAWLARYFEADLFGENPTRDAIDAAVGAEVAEGLDVLNGAWLAAHPKLVVASLDEMAAEVRRRGDALPDREARRARALAAEPRPFRLQRALAERAGHAYDRPTAAARVRYEGDEHWGHYFLTNRGPHVMLDLGTRALMFPTAHGTIDPETLVTAIDCEPEP